MYAAAIKSRKENKTSGSAYSVAQKKIGKRVAKKNQKNMDRRPRANHSPPGVNRSLGASGQIESSPQEVVQLASGKIIDFYTESKLVVNKLYKVQFFDFDNEPFYMILKYSLQGRSGYFQFIDEKNKSYWLPNHIIIDTNTKEDKIVEKIAEKKESKEDDVLAKLSMVEILSKALLDSGIPKKHHKNDNLFNMLLDIGAVELGNMDLDSKVTKLPEYHKNSLAYTSCHNTAVKLAKSMTTTPNALGSYTGLDKGQAKLKTDGKWLNQISTELAKAIIGEVEQSKRAIYEVHCGGHGFAILIRSGSIEIVQSFANAVSLVDRMKRGALTVENNIVHKLITDLASSKTSDRDNAAKFIAQCDGEVFGLTPYPAFQFRWRRQELLSDDLILKSFKEDLKAGFKIIKSILGL